VSAEPSNSTVTWFDGDRRKDIDDRNFV